METPYYFLTQAKDLLAKKHHIPDNLRTGFYQNLCKVATREGYAIVISIDTFDALDNILSNHADSMSKESPANFCAALRRDLAKNGLLRLGTVEGDSSQSVAINEDNPGDLCVQDHD
jgi:hypothetical protein